MRSGVGAFCFGSVLVWRFLLFAWLAVPEEVLAEGGEELACPARAGPGEAPDKSAQASARHAAIESHFIRLSLFSGR